MLPAVNYTTTVNLPWFLGGIANFCPVDQLWVSLQPLNKSFHFCDFFFLSLYDVIC